MTSRDPQIEGLHQQSDEAFMAGDTEGLSAAQAKLDEIVTDEKAKPFADPLEEMYARGLSEVKDLSSRLTKQDTEDLETLVLAAKTPKHRKEMMNWCAFLMGCREFGPSVVPLNTEAQDVDAVKIEEE